MLSYTVEFAEFLRTINWDNKLFITVIVMPHVICCPSGRHLADSPKLVIVCSAACYCCSLAPERGQDFPYGHSKDRETCLVVKVSLVLEVCLTQDR